MMAGEKIMHPGPDAVKRLGAADGAAVAIRPRRSLPRVVFGLTWRVVPVTGTGLRHPRSWPWRAPTGLLAVTACLLAVGCGEKESAAPGAAATQPNTTASPASKPDAAATSRVPARCTRIVDGDTIEVSIGGKSYTVRYIGIDTPETVHPSKLVQCFGKEASAKNRELVNGKNVELEKDVSETDEYGRLLRYVYVDGLLVNAELVRLGYAHAISYPPDVKDQDLFVRLQQEAREAQRGLWASGACE